MSSAGGCRAISQRTVRPRFCCIGHPRRLDAILAENVEHGLAGGDQIVRNDAPVTSPPHRLRAHDRAAPFMPERAQPREPTMERWGQRVVGIVVKALVLPECIHVGWNVLRPRAQAAERGHVLVSDLELGQRLRKHIAIVLWIGARARNAADIDHASDLRFLQQLHELPHWPGCMSDGEKRVRHLSLAVDYRRMSLSAAPLCRATWSVLSLLISY